MRFFIFILVVFSYGCSSLNINDIYGTYVLKREGNDVPNRQIEIRKEGTFLYENDFHLESSKTEGYWILKKSKIILNSYDDYILNTHSLSEYFNENYPENELKFLFLYDNNSSGYGQLCIEYKDHFKEYSTDMEGVIRFNKNDLPPDNKIRLSIGMYFCDDLIYQIKNPKTNFIKIIINYEDRTRFSIEKYILKVSGEKLVDTEGNVYLKK